MSKQIGSMEGTEGVVGREGSAGHFAGKVRDGHRGKVREREPL
jgi:hypothetical protein